MSDSEVLGFSVGKPAPAPAPVSEDRVFTTPAGLVIPEHAAPAPVLIPDPEIPAPYIGRVLGVRARDRSEIHCRGALIRGNCSRILGLMATERKPRLRNYNCVLVTDTDERIVGPAITAVDRMSDSRIRFTFETWILLGPLRFLGFAILSPERRFVDRGQFVPAFCILDGAQNQFSLEVVVTVPDS